jgi:hypothetical protein
MTDWLQTIVSAGIGGGIVVAVFEYYSNKRLAKYNIISECQFKTFSELWKSLTDLKLKADGITLKVERL